jgi:hypothetical protein
MSRRDLAGRMWFGAESGATAPGGGTSQAVCRKLVETHLLPLARARATRTVLMLLEARRARPYLQPGDVIVLDNLRAHKHPRVRRIIARGGARVRCWRSAVDPPN